MEMEMLLFLWRRNPGKLFQENEQTTQTVVFEHLEGS